MNTRFEDIFDTNLIANPNSFIYLKDIIKLALKENNDFSSNKKDVLFIGIDFQLDFIEGGSLPIPGSKMDIYNTAKFIYKNIDYIDKLVYTFDNHYTKQIFHAAWWIDIDGNFPKPFTQITIKDIKDNKWFPRYKRNESIKCLEYLNSINESLIIWENHCLSMTIGKALEPQLANISYFFETYKNSKIERIEKGMNDISEMFGAIEPKFNPNGFKNSKLLQLISDYKKIYIAGEAKSHCVIETIEQISKHFNYKKEVLGKIYVLEDCMSIIPGFEESTENRFLNLQDKGLNIIKTKE